ncbi:MAG: hypothetical protein ABH854_05000 [Candidatus Diapherotrites archaeon]
MDLSKLAHLAAVAAIMILLIQFASAGSLGDVFGAFANLGKVKPQFDFDNSGGPITLNDVLVALASVSNLGSEIACTSNTACGTATYGAPYCDGNSVVRQEAFPLCINPGTKASKCDENLSITTFEQCAYGCLDGNCQPEPEPEPEPPATYCCDSSATNCQILNACSLGDQSGTIACKMRTGQNMYITGVNEGCTVSLQVEGGKMGSLYLNSNAPPSGQELSITVNGGIYPVHESLSSFSPWSGIFMQYCENVRLNVGSITTDRVLGPGLFTRFSSNNTITTGAITTLTTGTGGVGIAIHMLSNGNTVSSGDINSASRSVDIGNNSSNNAVSVGNITSKTGDGVGTTGGSNNTVAAGNIASNSRYGVYSINIDSLNNLVCAGNVWGSLGDCYNGSGATVMACENGTAIAGCESGSRTCGEC